MLFSRPFFPAPVAMTIELEKLPNCITSVHVALPPDRKKEERDKVVQGFMAQAQLRGFRPGKAPRSAVEMAYKGKITEETNQALINAGVRAAIQEHKLQVLSVQEVKDVRDEKDGPFLFTAHVVTRPEFELPDYEHLAIKAPPAEVREDEVDAGLERLRQRFADFQDEEPRPLAMGDLAVIDFSGRIDDKPLSEVIPGRDGEQLQGREGFWLKLEEGAFLPGFCEAIAGMSPGETREISVELPSDFPFKEIAARRLDYTVKLTGIKRQLLPDLNDEFAGKVLEGKTLDELRVTMRTEMENERRNLIEEGKRRQVMEQLNRAAEFDVPDHLVRNEAQRIANEIVRANSQRGLSDDEILGAKDEIRTNSQAAGRERVKSTFLLLAIAEKEGIKVEKDEFARRIHEYAARYKTPYEKMVRQLDEQNLLPAIEEELLTAKTLAFVTGKATVEALPAESISNEATPAA